MEPAPCPSREDAMMYVGYGAGCGSPSSIDSDGTFAYGQCCYTATVQYCAGRPFSTDHGLCVATLREGDTGWGGGGAPGMERPSAPVLDALLPHADSARSSPAGGALLRYSFAALSPEARAALAEAWARDALLEHASIASFARFSLELMAVGAPADLVEAAHRAALDEVRHARACFALASAYRGAPVGPSPFPFEGRVDVSGDLARIAARTVVEGCVGETIAAVLAAEQLAGATDPAVCAALSVIAEDEARHAELAWRVVAWAVQTGGERVRAAAAEAFEAALRGTGDVAPACDAGSPDVAAAHGRLSAAAARAAQTRAMDEIVRPCLAALLDEGRPARLSEVSA
jgi:hypothetical protein